MNTLLTEMDSSGEYINAEWKYDNHCIPSNLHCHDYYEIYFFLKGDIMFFVDDRIYKVNPEQFVIIPPFLMHGVVERKELSQYERGSLYMSSKALSNASFGQINLEQYINNITKSGYCFTLSYDDFSNIKELMCKANNNCKSVLPLDKFSLYSYIASILNIICRANNVSPLISPATSGNNLNYDILNYIDNHYNESLSINDIAKHFGISTSGLMHTFAEYTNHSIYNYILYRRITKAKELMYTDISLNDIAYKCGFNDYSNFLRAFKKHTGLSPKQYKSKLHISASTFPLRRVLDNHPQND